MSQLKEQFEAILKRAETLHEEAIDCARRISEAAGFLEGCPVVYRVKEWCGHYTYKYGVVAGGGFMKRVDGSDPAIYDYVPAVRVRTGPGDEHYLAVVEDVRHVGDPIPEEWVTTAPA